MANSIFCGYSDENTVWKSVDDADFKLNVDADNTILPEQPISISFHLTSNDLKPLVIGDTIVPFDYDSELHIEKNLRRIAVIC